MLIGDVMKHIKKIIILLAVAMIYIGTARGEVAQVLQNAVLICLECIGIG